MDTDGKALDSITSTVNGFAFTKRFPSVSIRVYPVAIRGSTSFSRMNTHPSNEPRLSLPLIALIIASIASCLLLFSRNWTKLTPCLP